MRVALIGNSHLGRIKREWDLWCKEHPEVKQEYFIHRSMGTHPLRIQGSGAMDSFSDICLIEDKVLDPRDYDAVVVMGMSLGIQRVFELGHRYRRPEMPAQGGYLLSGATWDSALDDIFAGTDAVRIARAVKMHVPTRRVLIIPQAHPLEWVNTRSDFRLRWSEWAHAHDLASLYARTFQEALMRVTSALDVETVTQPAETIASQVWTKAEFGLAQADDPTNLYWPRKDYFHMNDLFARTLAPRLHQRLMHNNDHGSAEGSPEHLGTMPYL